MNDRELLEMAAKAVGLSIWKHGKNGGGFINNRAEAWDPLENDGDALRMVLDLNLQVRFSYPSQVGQNTREEANKIRCAAYRRAAVEMAAEIGRSMP